MWSFRYKHFTIIYNAIRNYLSNSSGWVDYVQFGLGQLRIHKCTLVALSLNWMPPMLRLPRQHRINQRSWFPTPRLHVILHVILSIQLHKHKRFMGKLKPHPIRNRLKLLPAHHFCALSQFDVICDQNELRSPAIDYELWFCH